jgi:hypothetical protein
MKSAQLGQRKAEGFEAKRTSARRLRVSLIGRHKFEEMPVEITEVD